MWDNKCHFELLNFGIILCSNRKLIHYVIMYILMFMNICIYLCQIYLFNLKALLLHTLCNLFFFFFRSPILVTRIFLWENFLEGMEGVLSIFFILFCEIIFLIRWEYCLLICLLAKSVCCIIVKQTCAIVRYPDALNF